MEDVFKKDYQNNKEEYFLEHEIDTLKYLTKKGKSSMEVAELLQA